MPNNIFSARRVTILIGLALTLILPLVPLLPGGRELLSVPGLDPLIGREPFWWTLATIVLLYVLVIERKPLTSIGLRKINWKTIVFGVVTAAVILGCVGSMIYFGFPLLHLKQNAGALQKMLSLPYWCRFIIVLRAAVVEEILFRGYGIERLQELTGNRFVAGALTLAAFTMAHLSYWGWTQLLIAGAAGLFLTIL